MCFLPNEFSWAGPRGDVAGVRWSRPVGDALGVRCVGPIVMVLGCLVERQAGDFAGKT